MGAKGAEVQTIRVWPKSLRPPNHRQLPTAFGTDNGRSALAAGTAPHAPKPTLIKGTGIGRVGWIPAIRWARGTDTLSRWRSFADAPLIVTIGNLWWPVLITV